jgi:hypothetical protein
MIKDVDSEIKVKTGTDYRDGVFTLLNKYNSHWFCTLKLTTYDDVTAKNLLRRWRYKIIPTNRIQIAYIGIIITSIYTGSHIHLLMFGKNKQGETLLDKDKKVFEKAWSDIAHRDAVIENILDEGVADYMSDPKNTPENYHELVDYNKKLLKKIEKNFDML